ncbi:MAG: oligosaccharide flippase family protein [Novosphingobium sp.]
MNHASPSELAEIPALPKVSIFQRLKELTLRDTNVVVASVILTNFLRALSSVILTRLLVPEVFGIAGIIGSVIFTFGMVSDLGFQAFVVRHPDGDKPRFLDTIWTMQVARSVILTLAVLATAPAVAALFGKQELEAVIAASAFTFVLEGVASLSLLTALRHRMILRLSVLELATLAFQIAVSVVLAYYWRNYWAILVSMLASNAFKSALSYAVFPHSFRKPAFDRTYINDLWKFARFVTGSSIITLLLLQTDKLVLARLMPLDHFGFYMLAANLATAPLAFTSAYASRVLFPYYSHSWRDGLPDLKELFYAKRRLASLLYCFAAGGLIGSAPLIVDILYDPRYATAATYLQIMSISSLFALASNASNEALTATGYIRVTFQANIVKFVGFAILGSVGYALWGIIGLVLAVGLMEIPPLLFKWFQLRRSGLLDMRQELLFLAAGIPGMAIGAAGSWLIIPLIA